MFKRMLLAVDGSDSNLHAADLAARLSAEWGAELTLVHVASSDRGVTKEGKEILAAIRQRITSQGGTVTRESIRVAGIRGSALEIVEAAKEDVADLIITGSRGHSAWAGAALGSVSQRILHLAPCPVLVVPGE